MPCFVSSRWDWCLYLRYPAPEIRLGASRRILSCGIHSRQDSLAVGKDWRHTAESRWISLASNLATCPPRDFSRTPRTFERTHRDAPCRPRADVQAARAETRTGDVRKKKWRRLIRRSRRHLWVMRHRVIDIEPETEAKNRSGLPFRVRPCPGAPRT
jgi:hypothetical protein